MNDRAAQGAASGGELVLVRHGETVGESSIRLNGATDVALSELGERQVARAAVALQRERFDTLVVSPLARARRSGELLAAGRVPPPTLRVVESFREINFGAWERLTFEEVQARDPEGYARWGSQGLEFQFPAGESRRGFVERVATAATPALFPSDARTLAALHKGVIKIVIAALTGLPQAEASRLPVALGGYYRLRHDGAAWRLIGEHETAHLGALDSGAR